MKQLLLVFLGGGLGSAARFLLAKFLNTPGTFLPWGTLLANIAGSFLIGLILGFAMKEQSLTQNQTLLLATGFCGGFTTFSAFAFENHLFLKNGDFGLLILYSAGSIALGLGAVFIGLMLSR